MNTRFTFIKSFVIVFVLLFSGGTMANIINVPADYTTIQSAINAATTGDTVLVQPGTYYEHINFNGKAITVGSLFITTSDESYISSTIINGGGSGSCAKFNSGETTASVLSGFTLTNGGAYYGAGINCYSGSSPTLSYLEILNNHGDYGDSYGGGLCCMSGCNPTCSNLTFTGNDANEGGAIYCHDNADGTFSYCEFSDNSSSHGGAMLISYSDPVIDHSLFYENDSPFGGAIYVSNYSTPEFVNCTFSENTSTYGGAFYCSDLGGQPTITNCILWDDVCSYNYEIFATSSYYAPIVTYTDVENGSGQNWFGIGCIDTDPIFTDPTNDDFTLQGISPCINAGDPSSPLDPDGTIADMGAFYFEETQVTQQINLSSGYSFVSSRVIPENPDMLIVLADVLNENLDYIRNSQGAVLRKIGPNWINGIGDWIIDEGYLVKMFVGDSFIIEGDAVDPSSPIPVTIGFQFVSYFPETQMDVLIAFETIIGDDLDFIRNSQGEVLRKIGPNWVNGIGDCSPGEGYLVKMFAADEIIYPIAAKSSGKTTIVPTHFSFVGGNAADPVFTIYIEGLDIGDEVAVFDNEKIVGANVINSDNVFKNSVPVFSTLNNRQGYEAGNTISIKVYDCEIKKEVPLSFEIEDPYGAAYSENYFPAEDGLYSIINIKKEVQNIEDNSEIITIYPNPSEGKFTIAINEHSGDVQIIVSDLQGKQYYNFELDETNLTQLDLSGLPAGIYLISFNGKNFNQVKKIMIQ